MNRRNDVRLESLTRLEFSKGLEDGHFRVAIIATDAIEQHLEHLAFPQDIASSTFVAERVAEKLYPDVVVAVPLSIGISEHHMHFPGSLSAKPASWLAVLFDAVESFVRHGIGRVLILNGHAGNVSPVEGVLDQWRFNLLRSYGRPLDSHVKERIHTHSDYTDALLQRDDPGLDLRFESYWELIPREYAEEVLDGESYPGHAGEFETSFSLYAMPDNVRPDAVAASGGDAAYATAEKGRALCERAIDGVEELVRDMLAK